MFLLLIEYVIKLDYTWDHLPLPLSEQQATEQPRYLG